MEAFSDVKGTVIIVLMIMSDHSHKTNFILCHLSICSDDEVTSSLHTVLESFLLRRVKSEVSTFNILNIKVYHPFCVVLGVARPANEE